MVRLGVTTSSSGQRHDGSGLYTQPEPDQHYSRQDHHLHHQHSQHRHAFEPCRNSSVLYEVENYSEPTSSGSHFSSNQAIHEVSPPTTHSLLTVQNTGGQISQVHPTGWSHRTVRSPNEGHLRTQKRPYRESDNPSPDVPSESKYTREVKWCPICRSPTLPSVVHQCAVVLQHESHNFTHRGTSDRTLHQVPLSSRESHVPVSTPSALSPTNIDHHHHDPNDSTHFLSRVPDLLPITPNPHQSATSEEGNRQGAVLTKPSLSKPNVPPPPPPPPPPPLPPPSATHPSLESPPHPEDHASSSHRVSSLGKSCQSMSSWPSNEGNLPSLENNAWETPTSLISRLTAGLTAHSNQQQQQEDKASSHRSCPSPSMSDSSDVSSFFCQKDPVQPEDPFQMAHQELVDEVLKLDPLTTSTHTLHMKIQRDKYMPSETGRSRTQRFTSSESVSSEPVHGDSSVCGSQDSDMEDNGNCRYLTENGQLPDLDTLLKTIKQPHLSPYVPDKSNIHDFLEPNEIGHINHMIKSLSDAVLTINLPDTLYKNKGFTPLDYMDIHLNAVMRQFFFVFKNEDFLNLMMSDQIALLNGCSLRAVCCAGLYLFNKDSGCWYIPGSTSRLNHPVVHVSDLLQVYPQCFVNRLFELNLAAAKLDFDWPMGVITNCILMYTPIKKYIQEMDKVDTLRNRYVNLLLKYISWKHGHHNASLIFPEILKVLDALLLVVEDLSSLTLNLSEDEVMAVEERLSALTLIQMAPFKCHSSKFKETIASWTSLECVKLGDIQNRLCMALQFCMLESLQSNTAEYWTTSSMLYTSNLSRDNHYLSQEKNLPQIMPSADKPSQKDLRFNQLPCIDQKPAQSCNKLAKVNSFLAEKDLVLLRKFLEDVTGKEGSLLIQNIKEKMDSNQIQMIIRKLCS